MDGFWKFFTRISAGNELRFRNLSLFPLTAPAGYANPFMAPDVTYAYIDEWSI